MKLKSLSKFLTPIVLSTSLLSCDPKVDELPVCHGDEITDLRVDHDYGRIGDSVISRESKNYLSSMSCEDYSWNVYALQEVDYYINNVDYGLPLYFNHLFLNDSLRLFGREYFFREFSVIGFYGVVDGVTSKNAESMILMVDSSGFVKLFSVYFSEYELPHELPIRIFGKEYFLKVRDVSGSGESLYESVSIEFRGGDLECPLYFDLKPYDHEFFYPLGFGFYAYAMKNQDKIDLRLYIYDNFVKFNLTPKYGSLYYGDSSTTLAYPPDELWSNSDGYGYIYKPVDFGITADILYSPVDGPVLRGFTISTTPCWDVRPWERN